MKPGKDYAFYPFLLAVTVITLLLLAGLIPPMSFGSITTKRINILSDIYEYRDMAEEFSQEEYSDTSFTSESLLAMEMSSLHASSTSSSGISQSWDVSQAGIVATPDDAVPASLTTTSHRGVAVPTGADKYGNPATLINDFTLQGRDMSHFYRSLSDGHHKRPVRIAVLGDSFIEADIITADLREQLQDLFGGCGVGFVPFASPLAQYRATVKHTFNGWQTYNVMKKKTAPVSVQDKFFVSGLVCVPNEGAWTKVEGTNFRKHANVSTVARLIFTNTGKSKIQVKINGQISGDFTPESSERVQQIKLRGDIRSIEVKVTNVAGFTGYGIVLEDEVGVSVDNFSIRGNSGMALFGTNSAVNGQAGDLLGYDLIILQYGLNSMSPTIVNYGPYGAQLGRIIKYVRDCFPSAALMMMSVGDRSTQRDGEYITMPAAKAMLEEQNKVARNSSTAFWNTFQAMGGENSMVKFVNNQWAARDYTHIGYPGGRYIATELVKSILHDYRDYSELAENAQLDESPVPTPPTVASDQQLIRFPLAPPNTADVKSPPPVQPAPQQQKWSLFPSKSNSKPTEPKR